MTDKAYTVKNCAAIILAAGQSGRLGRPKQLLKYQDKTLLQRAIDAAKQLSIQFIVMVLGSNADTILDESDTSGIHVVINDHWQTGMASTIHCGMQSLQKLNSNADTVILMVCDQPFVTSDLLNNLIKKHAETGKPIVASQYADTIGIPALFHKQMFLELMTLEGDSGAKKMMTQNKDILATIPFPKGSIDIDTLDDYEALGK